MYAVQTNQFSYELTDELRRIMSLRSVSKGSSLYRRGMDAKGIYLVESGSVRIQLPVIRNRSQLLEVVGAGAILGLTESLLGDKYSTTAQADEDTTAAFLARDGLLCFLESHHEFSTQVTRILSSHLHGLYHKYRGISAHSGRPRRRLLDEPLK